MDILTIYLNQLELIMLIWARISGLFLLAPVFSSRNITPTVKVAMSGILALISLPLLPPVHLPEQAIPFALLIATEMLIGLIIALFVQVVFAAIQLAGQLIDMQMGFFIVNVIDPEHGTQVPLIGNFKYLLALVCFLIIDGHHLLIKAIINSYNFFPIGTKIVNENLVALLIDLFRGLFSTALQISAPTVSALFITSVALGIIARTVPQMNVFLVGMPAKIGLGFVIIMLSLPYYIYLLASLFSRSYYQLDHFFNFFL